MKLKWKWNEFETEIENEFDMKFYIDETFEIKKVGDIKKIFTKQGVNAE